MDYKKILLIGIKTGVILILFTPLILGPFGISLSNYPKTVFFRTLTEIIFIFYLLLVFFDSRYLPKISILTLTISTYVGILLLTSLTGINFHLSFWGDLHRVEGVIFHLHVLIFFLILISVFHKKKDWILFFKLTVIVSAISSLAGVLQKLGIASFYALSSSRISGTWTNPDFFAPYITLAIFLTIFLLVIEKEKNWRVIWISILLLNCLALILSGTRAAWMGFGAGMFFLFLFWFFGSLTINQKKRRMVLFGILFLTILAFLIILNQDRLSLNDNYLFQRALSIFDLNAFFSSSRLPVWQVALQSWKDKPILGWGPESFSFLFDKHYKADFLRYIPEKIHFDRAHNKVLGVMTSSGIIGLLSYLSIFLVAFYLLNKFRKAKPLPGLILSAFFISYFVQNLSCFDTVGTYLLFFLVLGFINNNYKSSEQEFIEEEAEPRQLKGLKLLLIPILVFTSLVVFYQVNFKPTVACRAFVRGVESEKDFNKALLEYKKGISNNTLFDKSLRKELAARLIFFLENYTFPREVEREIIKILANDISPFLEEELEKPDRRYLDSYELLARTNERIYLFSGNPEAPKKMEEIVREALAFNDQKLVFYQLLGRAKIFQGNFSEGEVFFLKSFELGPGGFYNKVLLYKGLGLAYLKAGNKPKAAESFKKSLDIDFSIKKFADPSSRSVKETLGFAENLASIYCQEFNDLETCRQIYERAIEIFPVYQKQLQFNLEMLIEESYDKSF